MNRLSAHLGSRRSQGALLRIACWLPLLLLTACLEFEQQELHLRYDASADRMDVLLVYRGLYASEGNHGIPVKTQNPLPRALSDFKQAREHGAFAFEPRRFALHLAAPIVEPAGQGDCSIEPAHATTVQPEQHAEESGITVSVRTGWPASILQTSPQLAPLAFRVKAGNECALHAVVDWPTWCWL